MEIKYLQTLKTVLEAGSYKSAAERLHYTQSTVTFHVRQIEKELSLQLFEKVGRKMVLTQNGRDILPYVWSLLESYDQMASRSGRKEEIKGTLTAAAPESLLLYALPPVCRAFQTLAPNVYLTLRALDCTTIRGQMTHGHLDLAVHYDIGGYGPSVICQSLGECAMSLVAPPGLAAPETDFISADQEKDVELIVRDCYDVFGQRFKQYLKERGIVLRDHLQIGCIDAVKRCVKDGLGVAYLPAFTVGEELAAGTMQALDTGMTDQQIGVVLTYRREKWHSPAMQLFMRLLLETLPQSIDLKNKS